ncbi:MAG: SDR family NAD(P)-dependent oxidoreductase [Acidobacteriota bacterium]
MQALKDKIVFITGASSGIGEACARAFAADGARLLLAARRLGRLDLLASELAVPTHSISLDVRDRAVVEAAMSELPDEWSAIEILVNSAGLSRGMDKLQEADVHDWEEMIDTNVKGLLYVSRAVIPGMVARGRGHVINLGSVAGFEVYPGGNVYCASKAAVRSISQGLRMDLLGTSIRVTNIEPGMVETEFSLVRFHGDRDRAARVYQGIQPLTAADIAEIAVFCAGRPPHVDIAEVVVMPTAQASATQVYRKV